jgi:hypothetical protein
MTSARPMPNCISPFARAHMRHSFSIESLGGRPGWFGPSRYRYYCVRCHWMFQVQDSNVTALDDSCTPLPELEDRERTATFAVGPCPAIPLECLPLTRAIEAASPKTSPLTRLICWLRQSKVLSPAAAGSSFPHNGANAEYAARSLALGKASFSRVADEKSRHSHVRILRRPSAGCQPKQG